MRLGDGSAGLRIHHAFLVLLLLQALVLVSLRRQWQAIYSKYYVVNFSYMENKQFEDAKLPLEAWEEMEQGQGFIVRGGQHSGLQRVGNGSIMTSYTPPPPPRQIDEQGSQQQQQQQQQQHWPGGDQYEQPSSYGSNLTRARSWRCVKMPERSQILYSNPPWQSAPMNKTSIYLYSASYDNRTSTTNPAVRMISMLVSEKHRLDGMVCLLWYSRTACPYVRDLTEVLYLRHFEKVQYAQLRGYLISCDLNGLKTPPKYVSVVARSSLERFNQGGPMTVHNLLEVRTVDQGHEPEKTFCICVRPLYITSPTLIPRLVEWLELLNLMGAEAVSFFYYEVHPEVRLLLDMYRERDFVELKPFNLATHEAMHDMLTKIGKIHDRKNLFRIQGDIVAFNECLYSSISQCKYVANIDIDEMILPKHADNWHELIRHQEEDQNQPSSDVTYSSFEFHNTYFFDNASEFAHGPIEQDPAFLGVETNDIPSYMHMLSHHIRTYPITHLPKSMHRTSEVKGVLSHKASFCVRNCLVKTVPAKAAILAHYRQSCQKAIEDICSQVSRHVVEDRTVLRYKTRLTSRVAETMEQFEIRMMKQDQQKNAMLYLW